MKNKELEEIVLPALRGVMGDWVYYSCLMDLGELSSRVRYAEEIHKNKALSDMIQRQLKRGRSGRIARSAQIAEYLKMQPERFFNSLVVATYDGQPNWYALSDVRNKNTNNGLQNLMEETIASVGFLTLRGDEKLFAIDGQHRLAGIKKAVKDGLEHDPYDEVSVIFVAHEKDSSEGLERTRRLFTTLNKTAKPVSKGDIIALDEDDVMAICVRRLVEETDLFTDDRLAFVASNNVPVKNKTSLTTVGNLYDLLTILFTSSEFELKDKKPNLQRIRPDDEKLEEYFKYARELFIQLRNHFGELEEYFSSNNTEVIVRKSRGSHGGNALFRPIGLEIFVKIIARLTSDMPLIGAVQHAAMLPRTLNVPPYEGLMWDASNKAILTSHRVTLREILLYMLGRSEFSDETLLERYRKETGDEAIKLPEKVV